MIYAGTVTAKPLGPRAIDQEHALAARSRSELRPKGDILRETM
jgi:hypothetical protein